MTDTLSVRHQSFFTRDHVYCLNLVGAPRIGLGLLGPKPSVLPVYYAPLLPSNPLLISS